MVLLKFYLQNLLGKQIFLCYGVNCLSLLLLLVRNSVLKVLEQRGVRQDDTGGIEEWLKDSKLPSLNM